MTLQCVYLLFWLWIPWMDHWALCPSWTLTHGPWQSTDHTRIRSGSITRPSMWFLPELDSAFLYTPCRPTLAIAFEEIRGTIWARLVFQNQNWQISFLPLIVKRSRSLLLMMKLYGRTLRCHPCPCSQTSVMQLSTVSPSTLALVGLVWYTITW